MNMDFVVSQFTLIAAAFGAGALNAIAGGGSFLTFPALVYAGVTPIVANATSAFAVTPGYAGGVMGFRQELSELEPRAIWRMCASSVLGGVLGGLLLTITPAETFNVIVPILLLFATAAFAFGDRLVRHVRSARVSPELGVLAVSIYGGYFNGGLGIVLLALFALQGMTNLQLMNGLKNLISLILSLASLAVFSYGGLIDWPSALLMAIFATAGGYWAAGVSRGVSKRQLRAVVLVTGTVMSLLFIVRLL